ncbi:nucleotidyltransferase family protein [Candidatus Marsarchaeota archaeon]|jgi:mannose-1-phosphate guanylyltransferase|nr:nucleotidyltransferase family protein [Candidatus Marsarchaeota archaeon]
MSQYVKKAVVICGGEGTRLRPLTYQTPKPLVKVNGIPVIDNVIRELKRNGIEKITMAVGYKKEMFIEHFGNGSEKGLQIDYSIEDKLLGTGGAIKKALKEKSRPENGEDILVVNGDNIFEINLKAMYELHRSKDAIATLAVKAIDDVTGYGVISVENCIVRKFVEKPDPKDAESNLINLGIYIFNSGAMHMLPDSEAFSMERDFFAKIPGTGRLCAYVSDNIWYPIDTIERYRKASNEWRPPE